MRTTTDKVIRGLRFALLLTGAAWASSATSSEESLLGEDLIFGEIPSVFAASKFEQKVSDAPARTSIVTRKEIQRHGYRFLSEILQSMPGIYLQNDRNYLRLGVRGFNIPGDYNSRILVLVDGQRQNESVTQSADFDDLMILDVDLIERVEMVRGPGSSLYGSNAFFAVINIVTRSGRDVSGTEVVASYGSDETYQVRLSHGDRLSNGMEYLFSITGHDSDGQDRVFAAEFDDPATNNGFYDDNDDRRFGSFFGEFSFGNFALQGAYINREKRVPTGAFETVYNDPNSVTRDVRAYFNIKYQALLQDSSEVSAKLSYDVYRYYGDYPYDYADPGDPPDLVVLNDDAIGRRIGFEAQWSRQLFDLHRVTAGLEFIKPIKLYQTAFDSFETFLDVDTDEYTWGLFLQDEFRLRENLILSAGVRHDYFDSFGSSTNPRIALVWHAGGGTTFKGIYGTAFRAPSAYELFYEDGSQSQKPAGDLDPEEIETVELIVEQQIGASVRAILSAYHNTIEDVISAAEDPADGLLVFENRGDVEANGAEIEFLWHGKGGWQTGLSYSYQDAQDKASENRSINAPAHLWKVNMITPLWDERLTAAIDWQYESDRLTTARNRARSFNLTNFTLRSQGWLPGLSGSVGVYNLFDKPYSHPGGGEHTQDLLEQRGRTFQIKLQYTF